MALRCRSGQLLVTAWLVVALLLAPGPTAAAQGRGGSASADASAVVVEVSFDPTDDLGRWLGRDITGVVTVTVANNGSRALEAVAPTVVIDDRRLLMPSVDLDPGESADVSTSATLPGPSFRNRDIVAVLDGSAVATSHRTIPWALVALVTLAAHVALLAGRDHLRRRVEREVAAARS